MIILKGFPTIISEEIELPDISELLMYPYFFDTDLDSAYKHATSFQRKLIDMTPIDSSKNVYSLLSQVRVLLPDYRSCTGGGGPDYDADQEWHIDNEESEDGPHLYNEEKDIVTLLTNQTSAMTEFNKNEIRINLNPSTFPQFQDLHDFLFSNLKNGNPLGIEPQKMPANRLVTFTNHLHRATNPDKIEFRYMFRLVQTNRKRKPMPYDHRVNQSNILNQGNRFLNIERGNSSVKIMYPLGFKNSFKDYSQKEIIEIKKQEDKKESLIEMNTDKFNEYDFYFGNTVPDIEKLVITNIKFGKEFLSEGSVLRNFAKDNGIFLFRNEDFSDSNKNTKYLDFLSVVDKSIEIKSPDGEIITGRIEQDFFDFDTVNGPIAGGIAYLDDPSKIIPGVEYEVITNKDVKYRFEIQDGLKLIRE